MKISGITVYPFLFQVEFRPASDKWSMEGGMEVNEDESMDDDGNSFFCKLHYDPNLARFEDLPTVCMPEDIRNQACPLFCSACYLNKSKEKVGRERNREGGKGRERERERGREREREIVCLNVLAS